MDVEELKMYNIVLDGIDKSGKDVLAKYIWQLDRRLNIQVRGWPSQVVYAEKYQRNCTYALPDKMSLYVHVNVDFEDWKLRCIMTNEPKTSYKDDSLGFDNVFAMLKENNYYTVEVNTSRQSMYEIAKYIVNVVKSYNKYLSR